MATKTITIKKGGELYATAVISPYSNETQQRAAAGLRKELGKKFIRREMDDDESAEYGAECIRLILESLEMADGTRPILGKSPTAFRKFFRQAQNDSLGAAILREAMAFGSEDQTEFEVTSGN